MAYESYTGVVAREVDTGEADRYLTLLTVERGKLDCFAKGIRKQNSKLASQSGLMTYGEYQLFQKADRYILTSARALESFHDIRADVVKCAYAAHILEITRDVVAEAQAFPEALQALLNSLHVLCYRDLAPEFVTRVFEIRILSLAGFAPVLDRCTICGTPVQARDSLGAGFSVHGEGLVCGGPCRGQASGRVAPISRGAVRAMRYVAECGAGEIFGFSVSKAVSGELANIVPEYLQYQLGKEYKKPGEAERYKAFERDMIKVMENGRAYGRRGGQ